MVDLILGFNPGELWVIDVQHVAKFTGQPIDFTGE